MDEHGTDFETVILEHRKLIIPYWDRETPPEDLLDLEIRKLWDAIATMKFLLLDLNKRLAEREV